MFGEGGAYALDNFRSARGSVATWLQPAYCWRTDPHPSGCGVGDPRHQPGERATRCAVRIATPGGQRWTMLGQLVLALLARVLATALRRSALMLAAVVCLGGRPVCGDAQTLAASGAPAVVGAGTTTSQSYLIYIRPTQETEFSNYFFDAFGPYPVAVAAVTAGIDQMDNSPPEWNGGLKGYGKRIGSDFGIEAVSTTARYALSEALRQDPLYYRCDCRGMFPRLGHAVVSAFTARRGEDGHRVFSVPALVGPYAGSATAIFAWYPDRYGAKDALRIGNYSLLEYVGGNIALEFLNVSPRSWLSRMHLSSRHGAPDPGSSQ